MNIAICDDCMIDVIRLEKLIKASKLCPKDMEITRFISGEELLKSSIHFDGLFIDMHMEGMNGIDTAKKIRKCNSKAVLSFYSGYEVGAQKVLDCRPYRYLMKDFSEKELSEEIDLILAKIDEERRDSRSMKPLKVQYYSNVIQVQLSDIIYISINGKGSQIWVTHEKARELCGDEAEPEKSCLKSNRSVKEYFQELRECGFAYASASYIVNIANIQGYAKNEITLKGGTKLTVTRKMNKIFNQSFTSYWDSMSERRENHES